MSSTYRQDRFHFTLAACVLLCSTGTAWSQTSANLSLLSAYTGRGVTMDPHPVVQVRVEHDLATDCNTGRNTGCEAGWYVGGFASPVRLDQRRQAQLIAYAGRSQRIGATLTWDVGITRSRFTRGGAFDYSEFHVGLMQGGSSARLLYSPAYYGDERSLYLDLNHTYSLGDNWALALHAGVLHPFAGKEPGAVKERDSTDLRLTLGTQVGDYRFQAGWQKTFHPYHLPGTGAARALTAGVSRQF